jgi:CRP/FNR family transcriptional regulator
MKDLPSKRNKCKDCGVKSSSVFNLNDEELDRLCRNSVEIHFSRGEKIIKEGTFTQNIIFVKEGIYKMHQTGTGGKEEILKIDKGPAFVGISDVFAHDVHSYSVTALSSVKACFIDYRGYRHLIEKNGVFALEVMHILSKDITDNYRYFVDKIHKQLNAKLADALLFFSEGIFQSDEIEIPLTRTELGEYIGTSRESVTKLLHDLIKDHVIAVDGKLTRLINKELLKKISKAG